MRTDAKNVVLMIIRLVVLVVPVLCRKWLLIERHHNKAAACSAGKAGVRARGTAA